MSARRIADPQATVAAVSAVTPWLRGETQETPDRAALAAPLEKPSDPDPLRREEDFKQAILAARRH